MVWMFIWSQIKSFCHNLLPCIKNFFYTTFCIWSIEYENDMRKMKLVFNWSQNKSFNHKLFPTSDLKTYFSKVYNLLVYSDPSLTVRFVMIHMLSFFWKKQYMSNMLALLSNRYYLGNILGIEHEYTKNAWLKINFYIQAIIVNFNQS